MAGRSEVPDSVVAEDLTGTCWRDDMWLGFYGLHHANALDYFSVRVAGLCRDFAAAQQQQPEASG